MERLPVPVAFPALSRPAIYTGLVADAILNIISSQPTADPATWEQAVPSAPLVAYKLFPDISILLILLPPVLVADPVESSPEIYIGLVVEEISKTISSQPAAVPAVLLQAAVEAALLTYRKLPETRKSVIATRLVLALFPDESRAVINVGLVVDEISKTISSQLRALPIVGLQAVALPLFPTYNT